MVRTHRSIEIKRFDGFLVMSVAADWNDDERRLAFGQLMRVGRMPDSTTRLYWIQIKDQKGVVFLFNTVDWTDDDMRAGLAEICRLAGHPEDKTFHDHT
jgi:hypothetical protein